MSKKNKEQRFTREQIDAALLICHREYMMQVLGLLSYDESLKELNYSKTAVVTPDGGTYLTSILHIDGPKIDLEKFRKTKLEET